MEPNPEPAGPGDDVVCPICGLTWTFALVRDQFLTGSGEHDSHHWVSAWCRCIGHMAADHSIPRRVAEEMLQGPEVPDTSGRKPSLLPAWTV